MARRAVTRRRHGMSSVCATTSFLVTLAVLIVSSSPRLVLSSSHLETERVVLGDVGERTRR